MAEGSKDMDGIIKAVTDFPFDPMTYDDEDVEEGAADDLTPEEKRALALGKSLDEVRGSTKAKEAPAPKPKKEEAPAPKPKKEEAPAPKPAKEPESSGNEKELPYIQVTTDGKGRAQLGKKASAPSARWRVEVIDPKTEAPLPIGDLGETFIDLEGHPLLNYARLEHDLKSKIKDKVGDVQEEVKGIVDRVSGQEERLGNRKEDASFDFDSVLGELKGTPAHKYLTETKFVTDGENGEIVTSVDPSAMVKMILQKVAGYAGGKGGNRDKAVRALMEAIGVPTVEQADRLLDASYRLTDILPVQEDRLARRKESNAYWNDQFTQGLNLGGNFQKMYNYMLMDNHDRSRPMMTAFKDGKRQDIIDWDKFSGDVGPVGKLVRVHPSLDLPFLYADSEEAKALLDAAKGKDGKIDFKKLEDDLASKNAELFGEDKYLELEDSLTDRKTIVPSWELIQKYGTLQRSLGENWARFIRGTGGYGFGGGVGSKRLGPGSDLGTAQYNPVLRNLYARALKESPEVAKVLRDYYLNYGDEPFSPSGEQLLMLARQPELLAGNSLDWLYGDAGKGKLDRATGLSKRNLNTIADRLSSIIVFPEQLDYDELAEAFPGVYTPTGRLSKRGSPIFDKSENLMSKIAHIRDSWKASKGKGTWSRSPEWQKLVLRAYFEELIENPDLPRRLLDPSGFKKTYALGNLDQLESRQAASYYDLLDKVSEGAPLSSKELEAWKTYDIPISEARAFQYRLAKRMLDMMLNGSKNLQYIDGKGFVRNISSDKRVKKPVRRGKKIGRGLAALMASPLEGGHVSDKRAKEPSDWESWEARRRMLIGEDW